MVQMTHAAQNGKKIGLTRHGVSGVNGVFSCLVDQTLRAFLAGIASGGTGSATNAEQLIYFDPLIEEA
jgi:hypothetical protein